MKQDIRTNQQNKSYWLYQRMISDEMRNQGITMKKLVEYIDIPPTDIVLHEMFKNIAFVMYSKDSTTTLTREEMQNILDVYMIALASTGIYIEFPDREKQSLLNSYL